jgi:hypothetical protein
MAAKGAADLSSGILQPWRFIWSLTVPGVDVMKPKGTDGGCLVAASMWVRQNVNLFAAPPDTTPTAFCGFVRTPCG